MRRLAAIRSRALASGVLFALGLAAAGCHSRRPSNIPVPSSSTVPYDVPQSYPDIVWLSSVEEGRTRAGEEHKPMLVFARAAWSRASVVMDATIWKDGRVLAEAPRFIAVRIDLTPFYGESIPASLKEYEIETIPTTLVITSEGKIVGRFAAGKARPGEVAAAMREAK